MTGAGETAYSLAVARGREDVAEVLLACGANPHAAGGGRDAVR